MVIINTLRVTREVESTQKKATDEDRTEEKATDVDRMEENAKQKTEFFTLKESEVRQLPIPRYKQS